MSLSNDYVHWFRNSAPYINAHKGKTFVLVFGGEAVAHPNFATIIHDIALLNTLGVRLVLVHGARPQINQHCEALGESPKFHQRVRVTSPASLQAAKQAIGSVRADIEALLSMGLANSPMHGSSIRLVSGNFITAKPLGIIDGVDFEFTGAVRRIDRQAIKQHLDQGSVVLVSPLGFSPTGEVYNLLLDDLAIELSVNLSADKLVIFSSEEGVFDEDGELINQMDLAEARERIGEDRLRHTVVRACEAGIDRSHIVSFIHDGALLKELFTRDGCGTLITQNHYEHLRPATIDDVGGIIELIQPLEEAGVLVRRSRERLETEIECFTVIERDGMIIACAALYTFASNYSAELACITTHPYYRGGDRGDRLLEHIEKQARRAQMRSLFVLTTQTADWFRERNFNALSLDRLPEEKQALYNLQRNSKAFSKQL